MEQFANQREIPSEPAESYREAIYVEWSALAHELIAALACCRMCLQAYATPAEQDSRWQSLLGTVHRGVVHSTALANACIPTQAGDTSGSQNHPLAQLGRAYTAALESVGLAGLLLGGVTAEKMPPSAGDFVDLAYRAANALSQALDLAFGRRRLGSVSHLCAHVGALENQADSLFRGSVGALLGGRGELRAPRQWTRDRAETLRLLMVLEVLSDRCEDIADAVLVLTCVL